MVATQNDKFERHAILAILTFYRIKNSVSVYGKPKKTYKQLPSLTKTVRPIKLFGKYWQKLTVKWEKQKF